MDLSNILLEGYSILFEATVDEVYTRYYSDVDRDIFNQINKSDPTSKDGKKKGRYLPWLLKIYKNKNLKLEDLYKATDYLTTFDKYKNKLDTTDINKLNSLPDLYKTIEKVLENEEEYLSNKEEDELAKQESEKVYETDDILIVIPKTHRAACKYGKNTQWCTASKDESRYFDLYTNEGDLYIAIDKNNNDKYQFHPESNQYMNVNDEPIKEVPEFIKNDSTAMKKMVPIIFPLLTMTEISKYTTREQAIDISNKDFSNYYTLKLAHQLTLDDLDMKKVKHYLFDKVTKHIDNVIEINGNVFLVLEKSDEGIINLLHEYGAINFDENDIYNWSINDDSDIKYSSFDKTDINEQNIKTISEKYDVNIEDLPKDFSDWPDEIIDDVILPAYRAMTTHATESGIYKELESLATDFNSDGIGTIKLPDNTWAIVADANVVLSNDYYDNYYEQYEINDYKLNTDRLDSTHDYSIYNKEYFNEMIREHI